MGVMLTRYLLISARGTPLPSFLRNEVNEQKLFMKGHWSVAGASGVDVHESN